MPSGRIFGQDLATYQSFDHAQHMYIVHKDRSCLDQFPNARHIQSDTEGPDRYVSLKRCMYQRRLYKQI